MKATELQIGNWVKLNDPLQSGKAQVIGYFNGVIATKSEIVSAKVRIENIQPIPITEEWLIKNGFIHTCDEMDRCYTFYSCEIDGYFIEVTFGISNISSDNIVCHIDNAGRCSVAYADIRYVHQMQNLLNLVGINWEVKI